MDKNIQNDGLEDFLRKIFESHRESPPDDLWEKIEGELAPPLPPTPSTPSAHPANFTWIWIVIATMAALLVGIIIYQQIQHRQAIQRLSKEVKSTEEQLKQLEKLLKEQHRHEQYNPQAENKKLQNKKYDIQKNIGPEKISPPLYGQQKEKFPPDIKAENKGNNDLKTKSNNAAIFSGLTQTKSTAILSKAQNKEGLTILSLQFTDPFFLNYPDFKAIEPDLAAVELPTLAVHTGPVSAHRKHGNWSIGTNLWTMTTNERITSLRQRPVTGHGDQRTFDDDTSISGHSFMVGLSVNRELKNNWSIASGLNYRKTEFVSTHTPKLRFKDRRMHGTGPGGPHEHRHAFQYDLNTPTGVVEIELRAEQIDSMLQIDDNEEVDFRVKTSQNLEYASLPLLLNYLLGNSRLHFNLTGGIIGNILIRRDFEIYGATPLNNKFRLRRDEPSTVGRQLELRIFNFDYLASLGLEYDVTKSWSIFLSPSIVGSLSRRHNNPYIDSSEFSAGINIGMKWQL